MDTLKLAYLYCEFAFRAHFQSFVHVRTYNLKGVQNANQLVLTQGKIHEYLYECVNQSNCLFRKKSTFKCVD